jgi:tRNA threonylcarbamoyladenosine biosynthesis protein TsaE
VHSFDFTSQSVEQTVQLGQHIGERLAPGDVICLSGDLGAGKTALTRGIAAGWGAQEAVTSPTFTLIHEHHRAQDDQMLFHVDCYRLEGADDAWGIGLEDLLYGSHPVVLEWAEKVQDMLPAERLWIELSFLNGTQRHIHMTATGEHYRAIVEDVRAKIVGQTR